MYVGNLLFLVIDIGEEPFTSPSVHHTGTGKTSKSLNHMEDPDDTVQGKDFSYAGILSQVIGFCYQNVYSFNYT